MIKLLIACHKPAYVPPNALLAPIQVGAALAARRFPGMLQDDDGDNISAKNPQYCELTAQYWAWKNLDAEYYGFFHYRRYLAFDRIYPVGADGTIQGKHLRPYRELDRICGDLSAYGLTEERMEAVIRQYDLLAVLREPLNVSVQRQFEQYHDPRMLRELMVILQERYPDYVPAAEAYLQGKQAYYMNMFVMKRELFYTYAAWLFDLLGALEEQLQVQGAEEKKTLASQQFPDRMMGYLGERLFGIFYTYQRQQGLRCAELPYLMFYNTTPAENGGEPTEDAETDTNTNAQVRSFRLKPTPFCIKVDMRKLNRLFPAGSRRRLWLRSLFLR